MSKIDIPTVYRDRIKQIEIDKEKAKKDKKWTQVAKLEAEKVRLVKILTQ